MTDNEKTVLGKLIDELRAELSTTQLNCDMWHDRAEDMRNRLSVAQTENAKLRNEVDNLMDFEHLTSVAVAYAGCDECGEYKQTMLRLFAENTKLRELVHDMFGAYERVVCLLPDSYLKSVSQRGAMDFRERIQELESETIK